MEADQAKLFVGGISRETTSDTLKVHFDKYGFVLGSMIAKDRTTNVPRGFGFVWFSESSSVDKALQDDNHVILGRTVEVKKATPRTKSERQHQNQQQSREASKNSISTNRTDQVSTKKVFVGGLSASLSEEEFKKYFARFGTITDVVVIQDSQTGRPRGFGFITFDSEDSVDNVMMNSFHELNGRYVEVKRAVPKEGNNCDGGGGNKMRSKNGRGFSKNVRPGSEMLPGFVPLPVPYIYGTTIYGCWYPTGVYGGNGYAPWYGPMVLSSQACQFPYDSPIGTSYMNGVGIRTMGVGADWHNGTMGSGASGVNGHPADGTSWQVDGVKEDIDSSA
ncbi:RNA-binding protein 1 [Quillaja saponaria]|uniref:RNA-binding protein 1 n=1 Tax=Quillaja saponaria TaxID=32244 RepID=A0AAD7M0G3_QUISA|nr:RNA-binding protein 1 [Quillaja saponaria]